MLLVLGLGPGLSILTEFAVTSDASKAVPPHLQLVPVQTLLNSAVILFIIFLFYAPRYMRRKVVQAEQSLSPLLPKGEEDFHYLFSRISDPKPQLVGLAVLILLDSAVTLQPPLYDLNYILQSPVPVVATVASVIPGAIFSIGASSTLWVYFGSLLGIHRMGRSSLKLLPYSKDPTLGLRPVGSLSLSLAMVYFSIVGLFLIFISGWILATPIALGFESGLILLGLVMFFLPMVRIHRRMLQLKGVERNKLRERLALRLPDSSDPNSPSDVSQILMLDLMKREVSSISTWPFDTQILGKLLAIVLTVMSILSFLFTFFHPF